MKEIFDGFFKNKKVLVTGHTGFKGSWLSIWLRELGAEVVGYALDPYTKYDNFVVTDLENRITDIRGDVRDYDKVINTFNEHNPEIVFHLAAQPLVKLSYEKPRETYETNVMGTVNVLEAARKNKSTQVFINITSDKCYENKEWIWGYRENDTMGGYDPYSSSKGCSELITSAYMRSFFVNSTNNIGIASVRAGNVIGGGDWAKDRLIPDCISSIKIGKPILIRNPKSTRPWQHVLEPLYGYLLLASYLYKNPTEYSGSWNFGPSENLIMTVREVVEKLLKKWGSGRWVTEMPNSKEVHECRLLKLDISKAIYYLGWKPRLDFDKTLKLVVDWYKNENLDYSFDVQQIEEFLNVN